MLPMWVKTRTGSKACRKYFSPHQCSMHWYLSFDMGGLFCFAFAFHQRAESTAPQTTWDLSVYKLYPSPCPRRAEKSAKRCFGLQFLFSFIIFFSARGRIWRGGNIWTVGQTQEFKVFIKLTFPCPFGYTRLRFPLCPKRSKKKTANPPA